MALNETKTFLRSACLRKKRKRRCERMVEMKKILMLLAVLALVVPSFGTASVTMSIVDLGSGWAAIKYTATDCNAVAFGLNVSVNSGAKIKGIRNYFTGECNSVKKGYGIFPGTIAIDGSGNVTSWGTPIAPNTDPGASGTGLGTNTVVLELGALYTAGNAPPRTTSTLCELQVDKCCDMSVAVNSTRAGKDGSGADAGVVLDSATSLVPTLASNVHINYNCNTCNTCYGDVDGNGTVNTTDLSALTNLLYSAGSPYRITTTNSLYKRCADVDKNGTINTTDLSKLQNCLYAAGSPYRFNCTVTSKQCNTMP